MEEEDIAGGKVEDRGEVREIADQYIQAERKPACSPNAILVHT